MWPKSLRQIINPCINYFYGPKQVFRKFPVSAYYKIKVLTPSDVSTSWDIIRRSYIVDDPLCKLLGIARSKDIHVFQKYVENAANEGISLKAVTNDEQETIMGVCINNKFCPWDPEVLNKFCEQCTDDNMKRIFQCYYKIITSYNIFEQFPHPFIFDMGILSVDEKYQGKGIGYGLIRVALAFARDMGYPMAKVECTSAYSALICGRCKMDLVKTIPYEALKLGKVPEYPHCDVKIYIYDYQKINK